LEKANISEFPSHCLQFWCTENCKPVLRVCTTDEKPIDFLLWALPIVIAFLLLLSAVASLFLQILGDDVELYRFFGFVSANSIKDLMLAKFKIQLLSFKWHILESGTETSARQKELDEFDSTIKALIEKAEPEILNQPDKSTGNTCLHHAFNKGFYGLLLQMVQNEKGGNLNVRNKDGESIVSLLDLCDYEKIKKTKEAYESVIFQGKCKNFQGTEFLLKITSQVVAEIHEGIKTKRSRIFFTKISKIKDVPVGIGWLKELGATLIKFRTDDQIKEISNIYSKMFEKVVDSHRKEKKVNEHIFAQLKKMDEIVKLEKKFDIQSLLVWSIPPLEPFLFKKQLKLAKAMKILGANFFATNAEDKTPSLSYLESFDSHEKLSKGFAKFLVLHGCCKLVNSNNYSGFNVLMKSITPHSHQCLAPKDQDEFLTRQQSGLHVASYINCVHCVRLLLNLGSDVNAKNEDSKTSLHYALQDLEMLQILLENKPNADNIQSSMINAIEINNIDAVRLLLDFGADVNNISGKLKESPLHVAAKRRRNAAILKLLIKKGAYVNRKNIDGKSVLHYTAENQNVPMASQIIKAGADVNAKNGFGETALHLAAKLKDENFVQLLIDYEADATVCDCYGRLPLHNSAQYGVQRTFEILITEGPDINTPDKYGATALHLASKNREDNCDFLKFLIDLGANVNAKDKDGSTPLHHAARAGNANILAVLITAGADVNAIDIFGKTPLAAAITQKCNFSVFKKLIENGAHVKHNNSKKSSHSPTLISYFIGFDEDDDDYDYDEEDDNEDHFDNNGDIDRITNEIKNALEVSKKNYQNNLQKLIENVAHMEHDNLGNLSTSPTLIFFFYDEGDEDDEDDEGAKEDADYNEYHFDGIGDNDRNTNERQNTLVGTKKCDQNALPKLTQNEHKNFEISNIVIFTKGIIGHTSKKSADHECPNVIIVEKHKLKRTLFLLAENLIPCKRFLKMTLRKNVESTYSTDPDLTCQKCCQFFGLIPFPTSKESLME
jgi:ankyrin repeat protein